MLQYGRLWILNCFWGCAMFNYEGFTRFEKTRIIAARALQISMGAPVLIKTDMHDPKAISKMEFEKGILPITVKRRMPSVEE